MSWGAVPRFGGEVVKGLEWRGRKLSREISQGESVAPGSGRREGS